MDRMRFTSRLGIDDIILFLIRYGHFFDSVIEDELIKKDTDMTLFFNYNSVEYKMFCEDFGLRITKLSDSSLITRPSAEDWFCFLKSKFGKEYMEHFANVFNARQLILEDSKLISQISYDEITIIIRRLIEENRKRIKCFGTIGQIIEVESFYRSERRFWIESKQAGNGFFLRLSDTGVVTPSFSSYVFDRYMKGRFNEKYDEVRNLHVNSCVDTKSELTFDEFLPVQKATASLR